jgi:hypothetical protein
MSDVTSALGAHDTRARGEAPPAIQIASEQPVDGAPHARRLRVSSPGGVATTGHVVGFGSTDVEVDIASLSPPQPLAEWCEENDVRERGGT